MTRLRWRLASHLVVLVHALTERDTGPEPPVWIQEFGIAFVRANQWWARRAPRKASKINNRVL
jgi:hypothetical protein